MKISTIDITAKEWRDKVNGVYYFSVHVTVNYGLKSEKIYIVPFQNGGNDLYQYEGMKALVEAKVLPPVKETFELAPWRYQQKTGIIIRKVKIENCTKKDVVEFGQS